MARIIGVHGVGHQFKGEHLIRSEWLPALKDGLARGGHRLSRDSDFLCAFYGDLFRPLGKSAIDPPYEAADVVESWERELLELWWREAACLDPGVIGPDVRAKTSVTTGVQRALDALSHSKFFAGLAERALIYDLKQVRRYLHEPDIRRDARLRVERAITRDTRVVIGHSLGSVVSYEALCSIRNSPVEIFITIGSPLGIRNLIFERLDPGPNNGLGIWPHGIKHWVNIADGGDIVALTKKLGSYFGPQVTDHLVDNGAKAHDAARYLTTRELGDAIAIGF